jgi:hypothetical protein
MPLYEKNIFGQKDMWSSSKVLTLVHFILFAHIFTFCFIFTPHNYDQIVWGTNVDIWFFLKVC